MSIEAVANPSSVTHLGQGVTYFFRVTNTGNTTLNGITVSYVYTSPSTTDTVTSVTCFQTSISPGNSATCLTTTSHIVTQTDIKNGKINLTATATGVTPTGTHITSTPVNLSIPVSHPPALSVNTLVTGRSFPPAISASGQEINYSFVVENISATVLANVALTGAFITPSTADHLGAILCPAITLTPNDSVTCTAAPYVVTQTDINIGTIALSATATATNSQGVPVTPVTEETSLPTVDTPALSITSTAAPTKVSGSGQKIDYSFVVKNTGNVTVTKVTVTPTFTSPSTADHPITATCPTTTLTPGASVTCTASYVTTQTDVNNGSIDLSATAGGVDPTGGTVTSSPSVVSVPVAPPPSSRLLTIAPEATTTNMPFYIDGQIATIKAAGQQIKYDFKITNLYTVSMRTVSMSATFDAPFTADHLGLISCPTTTLTPGASMTCTASYVVTQADMNTEDPTPVRLIVLSDTAIGITPQGPVASTPNTIYESRVAVRVFSLPAISVVAQATTNKVTVAGQRIVYSFVVTNRGNIAVNRVAVTPTFTSPSTADRPITAICPAATITPGASVTCTASYVTTQTDMNNGIVSLSATASADLIGTPNYYTGLSSLVTSPVSTNVIALTQHGALALAPPSASPRITDAGQSVQPKFIAANTGNVTVTYPKVSENVINQPSPVHIGSGQCASVILQPTSATTCTPLSYTVTQAEMNSGTVLISAQATGKTEKGSVTSPTIEVAYPVTQSPALSITSTAAPTKVSGSGQKIDYSFVVKNTGNVTVTKVAVTPTFTSPSTADHPITATCPTTTLTPGASVTCTASYVTTQTDVNNGSIDISATAGGVDPTRGTVTSSPSVVSVPVTQAITPVPSGRTTHTNIVTGGGLPESPHPFWSGFLIAYLGLTMIILAIALLVRARCKFHVGRDNLQSPGG